MIMTQYQIYLAQKEKCETKGKHKPKENDSGNTFCVICGLLFDNRKSGVKIGEPLKEEDKIIVNKLEGYEQR